MMDAAIQVSDLTYSYPASRRALSGVSFAVAPGENVGLVGPNGAGKTTLFLCLTGVLLAKSGTIRVGGLDPADARQRRQLPRQVGIVFQNSDDQLFHSSVFDDVAFGPLNLELPPEEVRTRVSEALAQVGLTGSEARVPIHLSGGEKRRTALAGVLAMRPDVLLLDEPSSGLDPRGRREFMVLLQSLTSTKIIASHDLDLIVRSCERVLLLDGGRLIADGPTRQVLADAELMERHGLEVPHALH